MHTETSLRLFLAIPLPFELRRLVERAVHTNCAAAPGLRMVAPELLHLTLVFLGERPMDAPRHIDAALAPVLQTCDAFSLQLGGAGCFPNARRPRVLWIGIESGVEQLRAVHAALVTALAGSNLVERNDRVSPHLTIARVGDRVDPATARAIGEQWLAAHLPQLPPFAVSDLHLMRSVLRREGPEYSSVLSWPLASGRRRSADS